MTVSRQGLRSIMVDGVELCWRFRIASCGVADCPQDWSHVTIVDASREGEVVTCHVAPGTGPVTPKRVAGAARAALASGWRPGEGSGERNMGLPAST